MSNIRVDAQTLHSKANEIRNLKATHDENMARMKTLVTTLSDVFEGQAATAYVNRFESMQPTFASFSEMIEEFAVALDGVATTFTDTDTTLAGSLGK